MSEIKNKVISVDYKLFKDTAEGEMIESTEGKQPLVFLSGLGQMIPEFEANVVNLSVGEDFSFGIKSENAYGKRTEEAVIELEQEMFMKEGKLAEEVVIGNILPLQDQNGQVHPAKVMSVNEKTVTVDVNHPLADQDLHFTGNVVEVREATAEELAHGHVHGPGGHEH
ncbi:MAG: FKBP-type peptidyl-prolyl cis-trans isomerase [Vicingus serpentipes]|nr:FKBP-type peptidyl-prolyl cis-trans isomerase [Vicingus serpentipes]